jgi:hypothetical protein
VLKENHWYDLSRTIDQTGFIDINYICHKENVCQEKKERKLLRKLFTKKSFGYFE